MPHLRAMKRHGGRILLALVLGAAAVAAHSARAGEVDLPDFNLLSEGMSEAEVLYRLGPYDHETVYTDYYAFPIRKRWAYLPAPGRRGWITEITFNRSGRVERLDRYRP
ncbi:MAG: hypothetical protein ACT4NU_11625 [Chromatiales bacterium]